jgi:hypothetical protein
MTLRLWYLGKPFPAGRATFEETRLEIERTLDQAQLVEGHNKRRLLRRLSCLIILAEAIANGTRSPLAHNLATPMHLANLRRIVTLALRAAELNRRT